MDGGLSDVYVIVITNVQGVTSLVYGVDECGCLPEFMVSYILPVQCNVGCQYRRESSL